MKLEAHFKDLNTLPEVLENIRKQIVNGDTCGPNWFIKANPEPVAVLKEVKIRNYLLEYDRIKEKFYIMDSKSRKLLTTIYGEHSLIDYFIDKNYDYEEISDAINECYAD